MKSEIKFALLGAALAAFTLPGGAQSADAKASASASAPNGQTIQQRAENQQDRIDKGMKTGELTTGEASTLQKKEGAINEEVRDMRTADDGHLTAADRAKITQQQNQLSRQIRQDTHNAAEQNPRPAGELGRRMENQQDRIQQGVKSGELTPRQAARLEKKQDKIQKEVRDDRADNGGRLTPRERVQVNRQMNRESRQIGGATHSGRH